MRRHGQEQLQSIGRLCRPNEAHPLFSYGCCHHLPSARGCDMTQPERTPCCTSPLRARCESHHCGKPANWSIFIPPGRWIKALPHGRFSFMCHGCKDDHLNNYPKPMRGIDRPEGADEYWKPSILDHLRFAEMQIEQDRRQRREQSFSFQTSIPRDKQDPAWLAKIDRMFTDTQT